MRVYVHQRIGFTPNRFVELVVGIIQRVEQRQEVIGLDYLLKYLFRKVPQFTPRPG